jgi:CMP-N-acetylneuraminic acid synthetase
MTHKIVALVPMRHDSERVPAKNRRLFAGQPLYTYILNSLLSAECVGHVIVDTDSEEINLAITERYGDAVTLVDRPQELLGGDVPMNDIIKHDMSISKAEYFLQTHTTNPMLGSDTIDDSIRCYFSNRDRYDSLFTVTKRNVRLWGKGANPLNHDPKKLIRTQDMEPFYEENSCLYIFDREIMFDRGARIGKKPYMYELNKYESMDIDDQEDFDLLERICMSRKL